MSAHPATVRWLAAHELRLSWRDWFYLFAAGKKARSRRIGILLIVGALLAHAFALFVIGRFTAEDFPVSRANYLLLTSGLLLYFCLMASQAMEAATRVLYARADLELLHSSPVALRRVFVVRLTMIAISIGSMAMLIASPFINVLAWREGAQWLAAYGVVFSTGCVAAALAITLTAFLFNVVGPRRTRFAAQLVAAIVGALFVIGLQIIAIFTADTLSHLAVLRNDWVVALSPAEDSLWWWPARAALGDGVKLAWVLGGAAALAAAAIAVFSWRFERYTALAANIGESGSVRQGKAGSFRLTSPRQALRRKEWTLLLRDPWLISQSLMQLLYMLPPAILLWKNYGHSTDALVLIIPVLVMASGQLAGGLAWLAISGEDAPDLVATAPVTATSIIRAKVEAVLRAIMIVVAPFVLALAMVSTRHALVLAAGAALAAISATMIQLWFRAQARRAQFHRRQTSSRIATFAEAFSSIGWAGTAALYAAGITAASVVTGILTVLTLVVTYSAAPKAARSD
jgi:ABC-2 type transport system permease protein